MKRKTRNNPLWTAMFVTVALLFVAIHAEADDNKAEGLACVTWTADAPFVGLAYNHLVHLKNTCDRTAVCKVKTDVNPKEETVSLAPKEQKTQLTFRGSPARVFKAVVHCTLK